MCRQLSPQTRNTGCGTQQLLRIRLHLAGRGPNNSSLFPPLAAVIAVALTRERKGGCFMTFEQVVLLLSLLGGAIYVTFQITWTISNGKKK